MGRIKNGERRPGVCHHGLLESRGVEGRGVWNETVTEGRRQRQTEANGPEEGRGEDVARNRHEERYAYETMIEKLLKYVTIV